MTSAVDDAIGNLGVMMHYETHLQPSEGEETLDFVLRDWTPGVIDEELPRFRRRRCKGKREI